jgi:hypothetical protein
MSEFEKGMHALRTELRDQMRARTKELFDDFYPRLTDREIEDALRASGIFDDLDIEVIQVFYETRSYRKTVERTEVTGLGGVRMRVMRALRDLPPSSHLRTALDMAYRHLDVASTAWLEG